VETLDSDPHKQAASTIISGLLVIRQEFPWKAPNVERRIMQAATIRWDFPQGHADERSAQCWDKIPGL